MVGHLSFFWYRLTVRPPFETVSPFIGTLRIKEMPFKGVPTRFLEKKMVGYPSLFILEYRVRWKSLWKDVNT